MTGDPKEPPGMIGPPPSARGVPAVPADPAEHALHFARDWSDVAEAFGFPQVLASVLIEARRERFARVFHRQQHHVLPKNRRRRHADLIDPASSSAPGPSP